MYRAGLVCLLLACAAAPAGAQRRPQPQLLLTIFGGVASGAYLWEINRQPFAREDDATTLDTLRLSRRLASALTLGASATLFPGPNLGFTGEIAYLGFDLDDTCQMTYTDPALVNQGETALVCGDITRVGASAVTLAFSLGAIYRVAPRGFASPYVRAQAGISARSSSTVEMQGRYTRNGQPFTRLVIGDPAGGAVNPTAAVGVGVMIPFAPGYQARLELRDHLLFVRRAAGPADNLLVPPTTTELAHSVGLLLKIDIVLEQRRGRRY